MTPKVTAIVLNWCGESDTAACIESLRASSYGDLTVLLVDNASPDGSGDRLHARFPDVPFMQTGANLGYAGGNNRGIAWALERGCDYVLIVNDDAVVDRACVSALVQTAERTAAAAVGPQIRYFDEPDIVACGAGRFSRMRALGVHRDFLEPTRAPGPPVPVDFLSGCCVLLRADALRALGAFDESYFAYVEDAELSHRYVKAGRTLVYEPSAQVLHKAKRGAADSAFQIRQRDRNRRRLAVRHYSLAESALFRAWFYPTRFVHLVRYLVARDWARASAIVEGTFGSITEPFARRTSHR